MSIAAGSIVALKNFSPLCTYGAVSVIWQSPMFGVVDSGTEDTGPFVVNWGTGEQQTVVADALDEIVDATDTNLIGHIVQIEGDNGSARITVVAEYNRVSAGADVVLGQTQSGAWRELVASEVEVVS
jgi:hypothetical protein